MQRHGWTLLFHDNLIEQMKELVELEEEILRQDALVVDRVGLARIVGPRAL